MKKGNAFRLLILIIGLAVVVASISVSIAYMLRSSDEITNTFIPAKVACQINETVVDKTVGDKSVPYKTSVTAQNTGNIQAYIRVRVVTYWEDSKGNPVARNSPEIEFGEGGAWKHNQTDWIYDAADQTFYYKTPVDAGKSTNDLLKLEGEFDGIELTVIEVLQGSVSFTYHAVVEFIVEGIQAAPNAAVTSAWGVTLDSAGNITAPKN